MVCYAGVLLPLPGESVESSALELGATSKTVASSMAQLLTAANQGKGGGGEGRFIGGCSLVPRLSKGGSGKESLVHTVCACIKLCTRLARAMTCYDVLVTFDRVLTSALTDF